MTFKTLSQVDSLARAGLVAAFALALGAAACSSSDSPAEGAATSDAAPEAAACASPGGAVSGPADAHCSIDGGVVKQATDENACHVDAGMHGDAGMDMGDAGDMPMELGETLHGNEGDDDDCKYHLVWSATPVCANAGVTFTATVTKTVDGSPLTGAHPDLEVFLDDAHAASTSDLTSVETTPGTYEVGPVVFDAAGTWTVRFHLRDDCSDLEPASPHGHVAFFVAVP